MLLELRPLVAAEQTEDAVEGLGSVVLCRLVFVAVLLELEAQVAVLAQVEGLLFVTRTTTEEAL